MRRKVSITANHLAALFATTNKSAPSLLYHLGHQTNPRVWKTKPYALCHLSGGCHFG
jgi:hypothetical protein